MAEQSKAVPESDKPLVIATKKCWYCGIYSPNPLALLHQRFEIFIPSGCGSVSPWGLFAPWSWGGRAELCPGKPAARHHAVPSCSPCMSYFISFSFGGVAQGSVMPSAVGPHVTRVCGEVGGCSVPLSHPPRAVLSASPAAPSSFLRAQHQCGL